MGSSIKTSLGSSTTARPKKTAKNLIVTLKLTPKKLMKFETATFKSEPEVKSSSLKTPSASTPNSLPVAASSPGENLSESNSNTPAPSGTDDPTSMPPPTGATRKNAKTGVKRTSEQADGLKQRGKPGPKKKAKLEDGSSDNAIVSKMSAAAGATAAAHKLGPKANQGAINAGLRALDRSGKPCRKWQKSTFQIKTFTGTAWELPRWRAPPKFSSNDDIKESISESSSKENKENSQMDSEKSNSGDVEMHSTGSATASIAASSPAPPMIATAS